MADTERPLDTAPAEPGPPDAEPGPPDAAPGQPDPAPAEPGFGPAEPGEPDTAPAGPAPSDDLQADGAKAEPEPDEPDLAPGGRSAALRIARLHLRMGSLALARAELESLAGRGALDEPALLDLAEARWRTGDTAGAGEAANAALERGAEDPLAFVIAAEAVAALGRPAEARRLAALATDRLDGGLDALFAGMPRSGAWPGEELRAAALVAAGGQRVRAERDEDVAPAPAGAAEAFAGGRAALGSGDPAMAALRLGVAIRLEPKYAQAVLAVIGDRAGDPFLALVAGDALRLLGREHEALDAYDRARGKPRVAEPEAPASGSEDGDA
jgi:tetratricopeptide (TPR) repeat protein